MSKETLPLQYDLFSGELVDNRTEYQKRKDNERNSPRQLQMFATPDTVQFGVSARPWLKDAPQPQLVLEIQETRTPEEIERVLRRKAENETVPLFGDAATSFHEDPLTTNPPPCRVIFRALDDPRLDGLRIVF